MNMKSCVKEEVIYSITNSRLMHSDTVMQAVMCQMQEIQILTNMLVHCLCNSCKGRERAYYMYGGLRKPSHSNPNVSNTSIFNLYIFIFKL